MKEGCIKNGEGWMKNDKVWMKNDEGWKMKDEGWWFQAVEGFCFMTDGRTFAIVESLSRLKILLDFQTEYQKCCWWFVET